eukprot:scaffold1073_cov383-Prasinococcus_capsulatus_cf.AAC.12
MQWLHALRQAAQGRGRGVLMTGSFAVAAVIAAGTVATRVVAVARQLPRRRRPRRTTLAALAPRGGTARLALAIAASRTPCTTAQRTKPEYHSCPLLVRAPPRPPTRTAAAAAAMRPQRGPGCRLVRSTNAGACKRRRGGRRHRRDIVSGTPSCAAHPRGTHSHTHGVGAAAASRRVVDRAAAPAGGAPELQ